MKLTGDINPIHTKRFSGKHGLSHTISAVMYNLFANRKENLCSFEVNELNPVFMEMDLDITRSTLSESIEMPYGNFSFLKGYDPIKLRCSKHLEFVEKFSTKKSTSTLSKYLAAAQISGYTYGLLDTVYSSTIGAKRNDGFQAAYSSLKIEFTDADLGSSFELGLDNYSIRKVNGRLNFDQTIIGTSLGNVIFRAECGYTVMKTDTLVKSLNRLTKKLV